MTAYSQPLKNHMTPEDQRAETDWMFIEAAHILADGYDITITDIDIATRSINVNGDPQHAIEFYTKLGEIVPGAIDMDDEDADCFIS